MNNNQTKRWLLFCEPCSYRRIIEEGIQYIDLVEIPTSPVPGGAPKRDPVTKKVNEAKSTSRNKKYKCPQCGRGVVTKKLPDVYNKAIKNNEKIKHEEEEKKRKQIQEERASKEIELIGEGEQNESKDKPT